MNKEAVKDEATVTANMRLHRLSKAKVADFLRKGSDD